MANDIVPPLAVERLVKLRFVADGPLEDSEREAAAHIRPLLASRGFEADDYDIAAAYSEWCEDCYGASWLPLDFMNEKQVDSFLRFLVPAI